MVLLQLLQPFLLNVQVSQQEHSRMNCCLQLALWEKAPRDDVLLPCVFVLSTSLFGIQHRQQECQQHVPCTRMLDFGQFDFGQFDFGELAEIESAEVEIGRTRNWPKSKLAEVEINWPKSNRWCLLCFCFLSFFFFFCFVFLLSFTFFLFLLISLFILFLFCFCVRPQKPELNPKPRTLHPISDGPFRWTPPLVNPPPPDNPPPDNPPPDNPPLDIPPPDRPKFRSFFPPPATIFILLSLSWGPFVEFCWCF